MALTEAALSTVSTLLCIQQITNVQKRGNNMHATISCQYYAQNVKVNLGHNFQVRGENGKER